MLIASVRDDLCLDFANTQYWRGSAPAAETLHGFDDLAGFLERGVGAAALAPMRAWAREHPKKADALFADALALREGIYRTFSALAAGKPADNADFAALNAALAEAPARTALARADSGYGWRIDTPRPSAARLLAPVLWSAADLLVSSGARRIRQCANEKCLWLFVDASKGGTRRWCQMSSCGNRAKARRHYSKMKEA
ncbi:MAG TPA: ABATE domain-containing protein [Pseudolabrys sp.]|nr:ABATE domain-containing protein [Pseudolabrys sp.]